MMRAEPGHCGEAVFRNSQSKVGCASSEGSQVSCAGLTGLSAIRVKHQQDDPGSQKDEGGPVRPDCLL